MVMTAETFYSHSEQKMKARSLQKPNTRIYPPYHNFTHIHLVQKQMGNCSTTPHKHHRHRYIPVSDDSSSNAYSPTKNKRDEAKTNHNDELLSLVGTSNNNMPSSPYLEREMISSPTAMGGDKSLINHILTQYSPIIQTPYSPIILTPPSTTTRIVGADDTVSVMNYTKPRPQSEETIIRAARPSTPQVERLVSNVGEDEHVDFTNQQETTTQNVDFLT